MKDDFIKQLSALADKNRLTIIEEIAKKGSMTCAEAEALTDLSQPTVSHHIKILIESGLLDAKKSGRFNVLTVNKKAFASVLGTIKKVAA
jgi:ArsR family transcriptional regulator, arsenate/arsenite/antimonite-responsive transcriptional repressor